MCPWTKNSVRGPHCFEMAIGWKIWHLICPFSQIRSYTCTECAMPHMILSYPPNNTVRKGWAMTSEVHAQKCQCLLTHKLTIQLHLHMEKITYPWVLTSQKENQRYAITLVPIKGHSTSSIRVGYTGNASRCNYNVQVPASCQGRLQEEETGASWLRQDQREEGWSETQHWGGSTWSDAKLPSALAQWWTLEGSHLQITILRKHYRLDIMLPTHRDIFCLHILS